GPSSSAGRMMRTTMTDLNDALSRIDADRLAQLALKLVRIESPTGETREVSERFAAALREGGCDVELDRSFPATPVVLARLSGGGPRTLILNGHLDTVPIPHPPPEIAAGRLFGRGALDMKGPLAA